MTAMELGSGDGKLALARNWKQCCRKCWLINRTLATNPLRKCSKPCSPTPLHRRYQHLPNAYRQLCRTKPVPNPSYSHQKGGTQIITHTLILASSPLGSGVQAFCIDWNECLGLLNSVIRSIQLLPGHSDRRTSHSSSENTRGQNT